MMTGTLHRLLTKRTHLALGGTVLAVIAAAAVVAIPALASAAGSNEVLAPRVRLHAGAIGEAVAVSGPLLDPVDRYSELIVRRVTKAAHRHEVVARKRAVKRKAREERERFAHLPGGVTMGTLESIAACESGGDPGAISADGTYRGKYQFDQGTWESVGGHGDPAAAPEAEQDYRAALLYSEAGSSPWPICG
jgi:hypothetical protein